MKVTRVDGRNLFAAKFAALSAMISFMGSP